MLGLIISSSLSLVLFILLVCKQLYKKPHCYTFLKLRPRKISVNKATVFSTEDVNFFIIPNNCIALNFKDFNLQFDFGLAESFICNYSRTLARCGNFELKFCKDGISLIGTGVFKFKINKPCCQFCYDSARKELKLLSYSIRFKNFEAVKLQSSEMLEFTVSGCGFIDLSSFNFRTLSNAEKNEVLKKHFGFYNTSKWQALPNFDISNSPENALKQKYLNELLKNTNKDIILLNESVEEINIFATAFRDSCVIDLDKLGFSQLVKIDCRGGKAKVIDVLSGFRIDFVCDKNLKTQQFCRLKTNYILLQAVGERKISIKIMPNIKLPISLNANLTMGLNIRFPPVDNLTSFLYNVNRLILHGVDVPLDKILKQLNFRFLNESARFMLAHTTINYINIFKSYNFLNNKNVKKMLCDALKFALLNKSVKKYLFLKRILPYITNQKVSDSVLDTITDLKDKVKSSEYEFYLTEVVGFRLSGHFLYLEPKKSAKFNFSIWCRNHKVNLVKNGTGTNMKIDNLVYYGVNYIDLREYLREINIEFV